MQKSDKMAQQTNRSRGPIIPRCVLSASLSWGCGRNPWSCAPGQLLTCFQNTYWMVKLLPPSGENISVEMLKVCLNLFLSLSYSCNWLGAYGFLKVTHAVICIHGTVNKYKLSHLQEKEL